MGLQACSEWIPRQELCFSPVALPAAILNELLHPGVSRQHGTLGNMLKKNSLPCRVYILKRLEMNP